MSPSSSFVISFKCKDKTMNIGWKSKVDQLVHSAQPQVQPVKEILTITNTNILTKQKVLFFAHMACTDLNYLLHITSVCGSRCEENRHYKQPWDRIIHVTYYQTQKDCKNMIKNMTHLL